MIQMMTNGRIGENSRIGIGPISCSIPSWKTRAPQSDRSRLENNNVTAEAHISLMKTSYTTDEGESSLGENPDEGKNSKKDIFKKNYNREL